MRSTLFALLVAALAAPAHAQAARVSHINVFVAATATEWTGTGVVLGVGDLLVVAASGAVAIERDGPNLAPTGDGTPAGLGTLEYRIGDGPAFPTGTLFVGAAGIAGEIKFRVRDSKYSDNTGTFDAQVIHVPAALIPPSTRVGPAASALVGASSGRTEQRAIEAAMKSDLRNLVVSQEMYFSDSVRYSPKLPPGFISSKDVTITLGPATKNGWMATASHARAPGVTCRIFVGTVTPTPANLSEGEPMCSAKP